MSTISWVNVALGLWLVVAGFLFPRANGTRVTEDIVAGLFIALAALWAVRAFRPLMSIGASWTVMLMGLWVLTAPFVLGYERRSVAVGNEVVVGLAVLTLGAANVFLKGRRPATAG